MRVYRYLFSLILIVSSNKKFTNTFYSDYSKSKSTIAALTEDFETGTKVSYTAENVTLSSGIWFFNNALLGSLASDHKNGAKAIRIRNLGSVRMNFDNTAGASSISIMHAVFGSDGNSDWELQVSTDGGSIYTKVGNTIVSSSTSLQTAVFTVNISGNIRIAIVKTSDDVNRINIDDIKIDPFIATSGVNVFSDNDHMLMGNPSFATNDTLNPENYLMRKPFFALSYNRTKGTPNWVSWHLDASDLDTFSRSEAFHADISLPQGWYQVCKTCYALSGFDRGHHCPSADRTASEEANIETFVMTNMFPQAPKLNSQRWQFMEGFERTLIQQGNEVYIIMGTYGTGGKGSKGSKNSINNGRVHVPSNVWKIILVLPDGTNDLTRITASTRVIAVDMPNINKKGSDWKSFRVSIDAIEAATGYDLLSNLSVAIQQILEARVDNQ